VILQLPWRCVTERPTLASAETAEQSNLQGVSTAEFSLSAAVAQRSTKTAVVDRTDAVGKWLQHANHVNVLLIVGVRRLQ